MNKHPDWLKFSDNTRKPSQMAVNLFTDMVPKKDSERICAIQDALEQGSDFPNSSPLRARTANSYLMEGHSRANAYVGSRFSENITMLLASSSTIHL